MSKTSNFFKTTAILSTALFTLLGGCAIEDPIDYTTDGYTGSPQGGAVLSSWAGTKYIGTSANEGATRIEINAENEVYVAGYTDSGESIEYGAGLNFLIKKIGADGSEVWGKNWGSGSTDILYGLGLDSSNNIYVTGVLTGGISEESLSYNGGSNDIYFAKLDQNGAIEFSENYGVSGGGDEVGLFTEVFNDQIYIAGSAGNISSDPFKGWADTFLKKYDSTNNNLWTRQLGSSSFDQATSIAVDSVGNIYIVGRSESYNFNGGSNSRNDIFIAKFHPDSSLLWYRVFGAGNSQEWASGVSTDGNDNVYVFGITQGAVGGSNSGGNDIFIRKYDSDGNDIWTTQIGTTLNDSVSQGKVYNNKLYITGKTAGLLGDASYGDNDGILLVYDLNGNQEKIIQWGSDQSDGAEDLAFDSFGNLFVVGTTAGSFDDQTNQGSNDIYIKQFTLAEISGVSTSDNTPPTAVSVAIDGGADNTTSSSVALTLSATDDQAVTQYFASESTTTPLTGDSGWDNYSTSVSYSFDNDTAETKTVNVWFKDAAGNISGSVSDNISLLPPQNIASIHATATAISVGTYSGTTHHASLAVDGDPRTTWTSNWHNPAWITVDLQNVYNISKIKIVWHGTSHSYYVESSIDNINWNTIIPTRNGLKSTTDEFSLGGINTRFIKVQMLTTDAPSHWIFQSQLGEIEIFE